VIFYEQNFHSVGEARIPGLTSPGALTLLNGLVIPFLKQDDCHVVRFVA